MQISLPAVFTFAVLLAGCNPQPLVQLPLNSARPQKLVIVVEENHSYSEIIGNSDAPYINRLADTGASFTSSFAVTHPSQPNYLAMFSGSTQGVLDDGAYPHDWFVGPNLGSELRAAGFTFAGYSEGLPEPGWDGNRAGNDADGYYYRKHNPWVNWQSAVVPLPAGKLPPSVNLPFTSFPSRFEDLPDLAFVVPNQQHDMHDGSIAQADAWLESNLGPYVEWARTHGSLLVLTFDEDDGREFNRVVTVVHGPLVRPGQYADLITHFNLLHTIEDLYALPHGPGTLLSGPLPSQIWSE